MAIIFGTNIAEIIDGTALADTIRALRGDDTVNGLGGDDFIYGQGGNDVLRGGDGDDLLNGSSGDDVLIGGDGNDVLQSAKGSDVLSGGLGDDTYWIRSAAAQLVESAGEGIDTIRMLELDALFYTMPANIENMILRPGVMGRGITVSGNELDNDIRYVGPKFHGGVTIMGGEGNDTLEVKGSATLWGGPGDDVIRSRTRSFVEIHGEDGNDRISGTGSLYGDAGDDIIGGGINSSLFGGDGDDVLSARRGSSIEGGEGNDTINGSGSLDGGPGNDTLGGGSLRDTLSGGPGDDSLFGGRNSDNIDGGEGDDFLDGGTVADRLDGGPGKDTYVGGLGQDTFIFDDGDFSGTTPDTADRIRDWQPKLDKIDLSAVDAIPATVADDPFTFIGSSPFSGTAGELRYEFPASGGTMILGDLTGDGVADIGIFHELHVDFEAYQFIL